MTVLRLEGVSKTWPGFSLDNIKLEVEDGEYLSILGPTGSGKTLLIETILGFHRPDQGELYINNRRVNDIKPESRQIGYVPQSTALFPHLTVRENIQFSLKVKGVGIEDLNKRCNEIITLLGLKGIEHRKPHNLSGGEKQKTALARAIAGHPQILLLDEPLSNVDEEGKRELLKSLISLHKRLENTVIHVTHDQTEALSHSDRVAILYKGKIEQTGTPSEIYEHPTTLHLAKFMGIENIIKLDVKTREILKIDSLPSTNYDAQKETYVAIRAENIRIFQKPSRELTTIKGTIKSQIHQGPNVILTLDADIPLQATTLRREHNENHLTNGDQVYIHIPQNKILQY